MKMRSKDDWLELLNSWRVSGLTKTEFCKHQQISLSMFYAWAKRIGFDLAPMMPNSNKIQIAARNAQTFVEFDIPPSPRTPLQDMKVFRMTTSYGAVLEIPL